MSRAEIFYNEQIKKTKLEIEKLNNVIAQISIIRLIIVVLGVIGAGYVYKNLSALQSVIVLILTAIIFSFVAIIHGKRIAKRSKLEVVLEYNEKGIKRINGEYRDFEDKGEDLLKDDHPFSNDLDVFGQNSLFQMINTTRTKSGRKKLGEILSLNELPTSNEIKIKQEAIKELAEKVIWRQELYVSSTFKKKKNNKEELEGLLSWCNEKSKNDTSRVIIASIFITITIVCVFLSILNIIPVSVVLLDLMINFAVIKVITKDMGEVIELFNTTKQSIKSYYKILELIEKEEFQSEYLRDLKLKIKESNNTSCTSEMKKLSDLLDWIGDSSGNAYFFIINVFVFVDVFILFNLNKWRVLNGDKVEKWLEVMGEFDALSSISNIAFDHENWCYSTINNNEEIICKDIAHPLIGERAVSNTFELKNLKQVALITGSNMSGKSTFLRTIGINLVLSYIGAPSCANKFNCSIMNIYTCMRTKDNLEESISSFYAEILRIKLIIEACKRGEKVFFLLDEIFKGTNSRDRHIGATVLIKQLIANGAVGLLSTHDLELCDLEEEIKEIENYNFREFYEENKIKFDYKLREGRSTTQNAVYLMKMAGIEIN